MAQTKEEKKAYKKKWAEDNRDKMSATSRRWRDRNKDKARESCRRYKRENKESVYETRKKWNATNRDKISLYGKRYYKKNREKIIERTRKYRSENLERDKEIKKIWSRINLDKRRQSGNVRRSTKSNVPATLTTEEWGDTLESFNHSCVYCGKPWEHQDHLIPLSKGGGYTKENIVPACAFCNQSKGPKTPIAFCGEEKTNDINEVLNGIG